MKRGIIFLSLCLISVLVISGCVPSKSPLMTKSSEFTKSLEHLPSQRGVTGVTIDNLMLNFNDYTGKLDIVMSDTSGRDIRKFEFYLIYDDYIDLDITDITPGYILNNQWVVDEFNDEHLMGQYVDWELYYPSAGTLLAVNFSFSEILEWPAYICFDTASTVTNYLQDFEGNNLDTIWGVWSQNSSGGYWWNPCVELMDANVEDCNGEWGGDAFEDECGICDNNPFNDCVQDCNGEWGGDAFEDECGICGGNGPGVSCWGANLYCDPDNSLYSDCMDNFLVCEEDDCELPPCDGEPIDLNYDGELNVLDLILLANFLTDMHEFNNWEKCMADANKDDSIDVLDIVLIKNLIVSIRL